MTEIVHYPNDKNPIRFDKNVAFNLMAFRDHGDDATLLKAVLLFTAFNHQENDLFGFYKLDPKEFAKKMFFSYKHLFDFHPDPFFIKNDPNAAALLEKEAKTDNGRMSMHRTWRTRLENALYVLTHKSIVDDYRYKDSDSIVITTKRFNFFDEITFQLEKVGKTKRVVYYYKPNIKYENNLKQYFSLGNIETYNSLKKASLSDGYLHLANMIASLSAEGKNTKSFHIDELAMILDISKYSRFNNYKRKVTEKFQRLAKSMENEVKGLDITWMEPIPGREDLVEYIVDGVTKRYQGIPVISWKLSTLEEKRKKDSDTFRNIFETELTRAMVQVFFNNYHSKMIGFNDESRKKYFYDWFFSDRDMDIKEIKFKDTFIETYKSSRGLVRASREYLNLLEYIHKIKEKHNCINYKDDQLILSLKGKDLYFKHLHQFMNHFREMKS